MTTFANDFGRLAATPEGPVPEDRFLADTDLLKAELSELHGEVSSSTVQTHIRAYRNVLARLELAIEAASRGQRSAELADPIALATEVRALNRTVGAICN